MMIDPKEVDRLIHADMASIKAYKELERKIKETEKTLVEAKKQLERLAHVRWGQAAAVEYARECVLKRIDQLYKKSDRLFKEEKI